MRHSTNARRTALCGVFSALALVLMLLGGVIPLATFCAPALAGLCVIPVVVEFGAKAGLMVYLAVSLLSFFCCPDIEMACIFIFLLGYYPLLKLKLDRIPSKWLRRGAKFAVFNAAVAAMYALLLLVFPVPALQAEMQDMALWGLVGLWLAGNVTFWVYDGALVNLYRVYLYRLRPRILGRRR